MSSEMRCKLNLKSSNPEVRDEQTAAVHMDKSNNCNPFHLLKVNEKVFRHSPLESYLLVFRLLPLAKKVFQHSV